MNLESALEKLYEDVSLSESLDDTASQMLLKWAERQLATLHANASDDDAFAEAFEKLRGLLRSVGRYTDRLPDMDLSTQTEALTAMSASAQELDVPLHVDTPMAQSARLSNAAIVASLLGENAPSSNLAKGFQAEAQASAEVKAEAQVSESHEQEIVAAVDTTPTGPAQAEPARPKPIDLIDPWGDTAEVDVQAESGAPTAEPPVNLLESLFRLVRSASSETPDPAKPVESHETPEASEDDQTPSKANPFSPRTPRLEDDVR
jgi:hypothetical protein